MADTSTSLTEEQKTILADYTAGKIDFATAGTNLTISGLSAHTINPLLIEARRPKNQG